MAGIKRKHDKAVARFIKNARKKVPQTAEGDFIFRAAKHVYKLKKENAALKAQIAENTEENKILGDPDAYQRRYIMMIGDAVANLVTYLRYFEKTDGSIVDSEVGAWKAE